MTSDDTITRNPADRIRARLVKSCRSIDPEFGIVHDPPSLDAFDAWDPFKLRARFDEI